MTSIAGNDAAQAAFFAAAQSRALHHAWLFTGPQGVGKAAFAARAAARLLAQGVDPAAVPTSDPLAESHPIRKLIEAGSHPDFRILTRLPKDPDKPDQDVARSIKIEQVRALQPLFANKPSLSTRRVIIIDAIDDLERNAANALLKNLEEPPVGTIFILISHAPGRLLPTIRSRCRLLRFDPLGDAEVAAIVRAEQPDASASEVEALVRAGAGSPGRALNFAGLDLASLEREIAAIVESGDPGHQIRNRLAKQLSGKASQPRYEAFLARVPTVIAERARVRQGEALRVAIEAYGEAGRISSTAIAQSFDVAPTVFEMGGILSRLAR